MHNSIATVQVPIDSGLYIERIIKKISTEGEANVDFTHNPSEDVANLTVYIYIYTTKLLQQIFS